MKDKMTLVVIKDIATYLIFLLIVANLAYSEKDPNMFPYRADLVNMFKDSVYTDGPSLDKVNMCYYLLVLYLCPPSLIIHILNDQLFRGILQNSLL